MKLIMIFSFLFVLICSCNLPPKDVRIILKAAGDNRPELERVINYYKNSGEKEKLKAAYFLIGNMDNKFTIDCEDIVKYDPIFEILDSLKKNDLLPFADNSPFLKAIWDSLINIKGTPSFTNSKIIPDYTTVKSDYLIENIDLSFKVREESKWGKAISFENFCEYVLSYRFNHEPIAKWRQYFYEKFKTKLYSINADSCLQLALAMNKIIPGANWFDIFKSYPYDIPSIKLDQKLVGACGQITFYNASAMRSLGLPVGIDYAPLWGNYSGGHNWNVLIMENGRSRHFDKYKFRNSKNDTLGIVFKWKAAKVFRKTFGRSENLNFTELREDVPEDLLDNHRIDVTHEYTKTFNIEIPLKYSSKPKKHAVICTFNNKSWVPQDWGKITNSKAFFNNMGADVLYLVMYFNKGELIPASDPFILRGNGNVDIIIYSKKKVQDMRLFRKFHPNDYPRRNSYFDDMLNGYFQGANKADFRDSIRLYTIKKIPEKIETSDIDCNMKFRYIRYVSPFPGRGNVAELEFFGGEMNYDTILIHGKVIGSPEVPYPNDTPYTNVFDGKLETYFDCDIDGLCWVGLDLEVPKRITRIRYCPRSDTNFILVGDTYELCYWDNGEWVSMGTQIAKDQFLFYSDVPYGGLYILHDLTKGKEERIFTYENNRQVFW